MFIDGVVIRVGVGADEFCLLDSEIELFLQVGGEGGKIGVFTSVCPGKARETFGFGFFSNEFGGEFYGALVVFAGFTQDGKLLGGEFVLIGL